MPRPRILGFAGFLLALPASLLLGQEDKRSRVYRIYPQQVELYLTTPTIAPSGSVSLSPNSPMAELRLGLEGFQLASQAFAETSGLQRASAMPARCPYGWWHLHLGAVPCPREALAACTAICWAHEFCGATLSWVIYTGLCQDSCECYPDGTP